MQTQNHINHFLNVCRRGLISHNDHIESFRVLMINHYKLFMIHHLNKSLIKESSNVNYCNDVSISHFQHHI